MKKYYLIGASVVFLVILLLSLPAIGGSCQFYGPLEKSACAPALLQTAGLGAVMGGLLVMLWKTPKEKVDDEEDDDNNNEIGEKDKGE